MVMPIPPKYRLFGDPLTDFGKCPCKHGILHLPCKECAAEVSARAQAIRKGDNA